jgi:hypothetical protein
MECLDYVNATCDLVIRDVHAHVCAAVQAHLLQPSCAKIRCNNLLQVEAECIAAYNWNDASPHTPYLAFNTANLMLGVRKISHDPPCDLFRGLSVRLTEVNGLCRQGRVIIWPQVRVCQSVR